MAKMIFVNLPVENVARSRGFFAALGYTFNEQFSDEKAACMVISDTIFAMLLARDFFKGFIKTDISDAKKVTEVLVALSAESREEVDTLMAKALAAGAAEPVPAQDLGFMYNRTFTDLDGHHWELVWMAQPQATLASTQTQGPGYLPRDARNLLAGAPWPQQSDKTKSEKADTHIGISTFSKIVPAASYSPT